MSHAATHPADVPDIPISERGPAPKRIVVAYGFWIFLLSDFVMFSAIFAAYAVLSGATAGGPRGRDLFDLRSVALETGFLLASSLACGFSVVAMRMKRLNLVYVAAAATFALGIAFLAVELNEFAGLVAQGFGPQRSAFLSAFFLLVGCHGAHVAAGLVWLVVMTAQVATLGPREKVQRRFFCFALFWHALDIIWVAVFSIVYLLGSI